MSVLTSHILSFRHMSAPFSFSSPSLALSLYLSLPGEAVPCAIYSFLASQRFDELIPFAISLGGDTDTIASMAGAIGGAYWGIETIPAQWVESCEGTREAIDLANSLHSLAP